MIRRAERRRRWTRRLELAADLFFWAWLAFALGWLAWHALPGFASFVGALGPP